MDNMQKIIITFEKIEYLWHKKSWVTVRSNMTVNTSLSQRLTEIALKNNLLKLEDIMEKKIE